MPGTKPWCLLAFVVSALLTGCEQNAEYRSLPAPVAEVPSVNVPLAARQKNWRGPDGSGSCVHASLSTHLHWLNKFELAQWWRSNYAGGEWSSRLRERLENAQVPFAYTEQANIRLLDDAHKTRRGAIIWWGQAHCCTFAGWAHGSDGKTYAAIIDNNHTDRLDFVERSQFHKAWAGYGGVGFMALFDPPSPPIWKSFERINEGWTW